MSRPPEIPFKQWVIEEAERRGLGYHGIYHHFRVGRYPNITLRKVNQRVVFVTVNTLPVTLPTNGRGRNVGALK